MTLFPFQKDPQDCQCWYSCSLCGAEIYFRGDHAQLGQGVICTVCLARSFPPNVLAVHQAGETLLEEVNW